MSNLYRGDVSNLAWWNFFDRVNRMNYSGGAPYSLHGHPGGVNTALIGWFQPDGREASHNWITAQGNANFNQIINNCHSICDHYAKVMRCLYGVIGSWSAYDIFFVAPGVNEAHRANVAGDLKAQLAVYSGNTAQWQVTNNYAAIANRLEYLKNLPAVDIRVCHSSCHTNCHGSRGRR